MPHSQVPIDGATLDERRGRLEALTAEFLRRPCSRELWTVSLLEEIDECYNRRLHALKNHLGDFTCRVYMEALDDYFKEIIEVCSQHWTRGIPLVVKLGDCDSQMKIFTNARSRLMSWHTMAMSGLSLPVPVPTRSFIQDFSALADSMASGLYMV